MHDIPCTRYVADQNQVKVTETVYCEPDPTMLPTCHPAEGDRHDAGAVFGDFKEHGHGEVEVRARRVAPAAIVVWKSVVRGTEVGGGDEDGRAAGVTPLLVVCAFDLKARSAAQPAVEECRAQRCSVHSVPLAVQVPVPACSS